MSRVSVCKRVEFDAAHRLLGYDGMCANIHGHRYVVELTLSGYVNEATGFVVDFSHIKSLFKKWLDLRWDHHVILHPDDALVNILRANEQLVFCDKSLGNPTAENMARYLFNLAAELFGNLDAWIELVRVYETPNSWAEARADF